MDIIKGTFLIQMLFSVIQHISGTEPVIANKINIKCLTHIR